MPWQRALDVALLAAREAGRILLADFHRRDGPRGAVDKADADLEAEGAIRGRLLAAFPSWGYLGEETGRVEGAPGEPIWLVDPNDGTRDYLAGQRGSAVAIGLLAGGRPVLGVVFAFAYPDSAGDLFAWAEGGGPLTRNGAAVDPRPPAALGPLDVVLVSSKGDRDPDGNLRCALPARFRTLPSIAHRLAVAAAGEAAAATSLHSPGAWDYGAGHALARAAGGVLLDERGRDVVYAPDGSSSARFAFSGAPALAAELAARPWHEIRGAAWGGFRPVRLERGRTVADPGVLARAQGCLFGQIAGDSLGSLVEFAPAEEIARRFPDGGPRLLADGGRWQTLAGQPTDDSEMALALARSLAAAGDWDGERVFAAYQDWYRSGPFDVGQTTRAALNGYHVGESQANGSLMRASPLGIFAHARAAAEAAALARRDSALTHPHPVCGDAVAAFVVAVAHAIREGGDAASAHEAALGGARGASAQPPVVRALEAARTGPPACDGEKQGWVLIALQSAFHALLHAPTLEEGVVSTVRRGGDTDTNAAIAGALLGAVHGRDGVPAQWRSMVLSCRAHPSRARHPRPMPFWPTDVLELAERLLLAGAPA
ncbi:MAG TPA: inositol monophosphatase family protein [Vicinamibacteria bacterium]|nr:inositol monophosphatase family protein [Vicinamibacteria bacterium]